MFLHHLRAYGFLSSKVCRGYNIGIRLIDEFLAKSKTTKCVDFRDTADKIARVKRNTSTRRLVFLSI